MSRRFQIPALILLYLLSTAKSCDHGERTDETRDRERIGRLQDSIRESFQADTLSMISLQAFEATAKNRLSDFSDYLSVVHDTSISGAFRQKAGEMIRGIFISENSTLQFTGSGFPGRKEVSVKQLLSDGKELPFTPGPVPGDSIRVIQALRRSSDSVYTGKLRFFCLPFAKNHEESRKFTPSYGTIDFLVTKHPKRFGKDTLSIWEVFLGNWP